MLKLHLIFAETALQEACGAVSDSGSFASRVDLKPLERAIDEALTECQTAIGNLEDEHHAEG